MDYLPDTSQRSALLEGLSRVIERCGFEHFVRAPILEPTGKFFPDPWEPSARGVRALSLRLLAYANLDGLDASVELYAEGPEDETAYHHGTAAWFAGIDEDGVCSFGADTRQLATGASIVGTMCHEIAHAFREQQGLVGKYRQIEEEETDITTVYLGFGILTTNNAHRFRKSGGLDGGMVVTQWSTTQTGYLSPQAMAFLLAAQVVARGLGGKDVKRIASHLETNQRAFFHASHRELSRNVDSLRVTLGIPPVEVWPSGRVLELPSLPENASFIPGEGTSAEETPRVSRNAGLTVFRVRTTRTRWGGFCGALLGSLGAAIYAGRSGAPMSTWTLGGLALGFAVGLLIGSRVRHDACSDATCSARIPDADATCPKCGGTIRGVIHDAEDRLEVEDALEEGKPLDVVLSGLAARRRVQRRKTAAVLAVVAAGIAVMMFSNRIPRPASVRSAINRSHEGVSVRLTGNVEDVFDEDVLRSKSDGTELSAFLLSDDSDSIKVWYELGSIERPLHKGAHVRLWGHFVPMNVHDLNGSVQDSRRFVATSLSVDD